MSNQAAFDRLDRLRAMSKKKPGTSGFSRAEIEAIQMAVDILDLLVDVDRSHGGDLEMYDVDDKDTPKMLCIGGSDEHYGETCFECFVNAAKALERLKSQADERHFNPGSQS